MTKFAAHLLSFVCCAVSVYGDDHPSADICSDGQKHYRATMRHIERGGIGYTTGYTTLETFIAADPSWGVATPFFDARCHVFDNGKWAANAGIGVRAIWGKRAYGVNTYYDFRNTKRLNYNQMGVGLETLGELFDFRINGYLPVGKKTTNPYEATFVGFSGHQMILSQNYQLAMKGADAEFGFHFGKSENFEFYTAAGPYYFIGQVGPNTWGGKAKIAGTYKDVITVELSDSYDSTFHNHFQGQIGFSFSFGPKSKVEKKKSINTCKSAHTMTRRMLQPVGRQEIIVTNEIKLNSAAIDPATGQPYFFVFVNNMSSSTGTIESPYPTLLQAQENSSPNDIIYVFPGDGTTRGMNSGITLQANQKFWGSGVNHTLQTSQGAITIPQQSATLPTITNTNADTEGNAIILATNNSISGVTITSAMNDAIHGDDSQSLEVSSCLFENMTTYPINATFSGDASISITDNQFLNNTNGIALHLNGSSTVACSDNIFKDQTSESSIPIEISADSNTFAAQIENNLFHHNRTGSIRFDLTDVVNADILVLNNTFTNNTSGSADTLGSNFVILPTGTTADCSVVASDNTFSGNARNAIYLHRSGEFTTLSVTASTNVISDTPGAGIVLATPVAHSLTLLATDNIITGLANNGIGVIDATQVTTTGVITISNNTITDIGGSSNGIAVNQDFTTLHLTLQNNEIDSCEGTGILSYAPTGIGTFILDASGNTISNCQNMGSNASPGLDIEQYTNLAGSITNNTLSDNAGTAVAIGSTLTAPRACLTLTGNNSSTDYLLTNPGDGIFNLSPCNVDDVNGGTINTSGTIDLVQSCPAATPCSP